MPTSCCAFGCTNRTSKKDCMERKVSFFKFPRDPLLKKAWLVQMRRQNFVPTYASKICSDHFDPQCFTIQKSTKSNRSLCYNALPTIFSFSNKNGKKSLSDPTISAVNDRCNAIASVPKDNDNGKLQFVSHIPGREPRGQAPTPTFKHFVLPSEISKAQSKLTETCNKLAVLHKRRLKLRANAKSKSFNLAESSTPSLYPPYETHFTNHKPLTSLPVQPPLETNLSSDEPLTGSSVDPPVEENLSSDVSPNSSPLYSDESSTSSWHPSLEEKFSFLESSNGSPLYSDESSSSSRAPHEENLSSDESLADSPLHPSVESNLSCEESSTNFSTPISSHGKDKTLKDNPHFQKLLAPLDEKSSDKKSCMVSSRIFSDKSLSSTSIFKFKHRNPPNFVEKEDSSIAKHLKRSDPIHNYYLEQVANQKDLEDGNALCSSSFRWEIANYKSKLNGRLVRACKEKQRLRKEIYRLRTRTLYWKQKNAALKSMLDKQETKQDA